MTINHVYTAFHLVLNILKNNTKYELTDIPINFCAKYIDVPLVSLVHYNTKRVVILRKSGSSNIEYLQGLG